MGNGVRLLSPDSTELLELAGEWLGREDNCKWLDFGGGVQALTPAMIKLMNQRDVNVVRLFTADDGHLPVGVVGFTNVDRRFRTANVWAVLGSKRHGGCTTPAVAELLTLGFRDPGLRTVTAWTVETNVAARHVLERLHFRYVGRRRQCHWIEGRPFDRLLFDLLASEHRAAA